jgi:SAM-dependent methyltransferase
LREHDISYFARWLVEPGSLGDLAVDGGRLVTASSGRAVPIVHGIPVFSARELSPQQLSELSFASRFVAERRATFQAGTPIMAERCFDWARPFVVPSLGDPSLCLLCVGGSMADDLPGMAAAHKFNVDHLAHVYPEFAAAEMAGEDTTFVSAHAEALPFRTGSVDILYTRNAIDHFDNPYRFLKEAHRVLKPDGMLLAASYFNSTFLDDHETKIVDDDFLARFLEPLFDRIHVEFRDVPQQPVVGPDPTRFIHFVGRPRPHGTIAVPDDRLDEGAELANAFQRALHEREKGNGAAAREAFAKVIACRPLVPSDAHRQLFAALQLAAMTDDAVLRSAAQDLHRAGLAEHWGVADRVLGLYGWTLEDLNGPIEGDPEIRIPGLLPPGKWRDLVARSADALRSR